MRTIALMVTVFFALMVCHGQDLVVEKVAYKGWSDCIRLSNGSIELIVPLQIGPRIMRLGFLDGPNFLFEKEEDLGRSGGEDWRLYGGHRLWHAPEASPRTYSPDNSAIQHEWSEGRLKLIQTVEPETGIQKEVEIFLGSGSDSVRIVHRLINRNLWEVELSAWCLTAMAAGGRAIIPQEEFRPHPDYLLPARPLVLWHYTDMADERWSWGTRFIQLRQQPGNSKKQKIGLFNTLGWAAYVLGEEVFVKRFPVETNAVYPDFGSNVEVFTDGAMLELESLGALMRLAPGGGSVEFEERWFLFKQTVPTGEAGIEAALKPLLERSP